MDEQEAYKRIKRIGLAKARADEKIIHYARTLQTTLMDAGRPAAAEELKALFFTRDTCDEEIEQLARENPKAALGAVARMIDAL